MPVTGLLYFFTLYIYIYIYIYIHISDVVEMVYELTLLPNKSESETFWRKSGAAQVLTGYLCLGCQPGGDWANT